MKNFLTQRVQNSMEMQSPTLNKLFESLAKAQQVMEGAKKDSANPYFKSKYADLASVWEACRSALTTHGLSVVQTIQTIDGQMQLISILGHSSGEWIKSMMPIKPAKEDIQALGAAVTYIRRFSLAALVGVSPEDDDAESAMDRSKKKEEEKPIYIKIPSDVNALRVQDFIKESAGKQFSENDIKKRANENMAGFLESFKKWETKKYPKENEGTYSESA